MGRESRPRPERIVKAQMRQLNYSGLYRDETINSNPIYPIFTLLSFSSILYLIITMIVQIYLDRHDFELMLKVLYVFNAQLFCFLKMLPFFFSKGKLVHLQNVLTSDLFNAQSEDQDHFLETAIASYSKCANFIKIILASCVTVHGLHGMMYGQTIIIPAWTPECILRYKGLPFIIQLTSFYFEIHNSTSLDCLVFGLLSMGTAQMEILKDTLTKFRDYEHEEQFSEEEINTMVKLRLTKCIRHHDEILKYVDDVQSMCNVGLFFQIGNSVITFVLTGVQMIKVPIISFDFPPVIIYVSAIACELALYCWFGHDLMAKSIDLLQACYMSRWNECDPKVRKMLLIIMERAKRPIIFTAGKFVPLTLHTFAGLMKSSYSYYAVLRRYADTN